MPELPEVEAARKAVEDHCLGRRIIKASVANDPIVISKTSAQALEDALTGKTILNAHRKGKHLWLQLDQRPWPSFQFGMTGAIVIKNVKGTKYKRSAVIDEEEWPSKFAKVVIQLESGVEMAFTDTRRFARVRLLHNPSTEQPISELGPDAFLDLPEEDQFVECVKQKKCSIKALLLDQTFLAGIGNWIADEVLYQAQIHPERSASSLSDDEGKGLHRAIQEVVQWAVKVNADSDQFPKEWIFHQRWNKKPGSLDGKKIDFITVHGRTSAYVPAVQKRSGLPLELTSSRNRRRSSKDETSEVAQPAVMTLRARGDCTH